MPYPSAEEGGMVPGLSHVLPSVLRNWYCVWSKAKDSFTLPTVMGPNAVALLL